MIPRIKPPSGKQNGGLSGPWRKSASERPPDRSVGPPPESGRRRGFGRNSLVSILFAILIVALWGGRAWQDLSSPSAWAYWKDLYFSPSLTSSVTQVELNGQSRRALAIKGEIGAAAANWFRDRLDGAKLGPGDVVLLSSPGGQLDQGIIMGEVIRARGLTTMVAVADAQGRLRASYCASACVFVYAGGTVREAFPGSALGVHQFTTDIPRSAEAGRDIVADTQRTSGFILDYMTRMGISPSILQAMSAMREIRWLSEKDAFDLKLSTDRYAAR